MRNEIKKAILLGLLQADGTPMPAAALNGLGMTVFPVPTLTEVKSVISELETKDFISGADEEIGGRTWTLTTKGKHAAQKI